MLFPGNRHSRVLLRPRSGRLGTGAESGQMDDRADARSHWLFLLSPVFAMAGQQNAHAPLGTGDHALRARRTLQTVVEWGVLVVKQKVLIIVENAPVPFDTRVWKEASSLHQNGYEVTVLCPAGKGYEQRHEVINGIRIYRHPVPKERNTPLGYLWEYCWSFFWEFLYTWWIFLRRGFHVIQGCNPPDDIFLIALPFKLLGIKYIFDHHDVSPELYLSKYGRKDVLYRVQVWLERLTYHCSDAVVVTNSSYRDRAVTRGGLDPKDVFIVRNGPDLRTFRPLPPRPALKHGKPYLIGYVGTMSVQEGLDILLDVALHIKDSGRRDVHFTCIGGGPGLAELRKMAQDKGLDDMFNFTGRIPDKQLLEILSTADVCVNPDRPCEMNDISTMIKIMEYMALAKPVVQFNLNEGRFSAQEASLYADNDKGAADFAAKIVWLLDHAEERKRRGEFGRRRVEQELAWQYSVENLLAAYQRAFSKRGARDGLEEISAVEVQAGSIRAGSIRAGEIRVDTEQTGVAQTNDTFVQYYRCPESYARLKLSGALSHRNGFFEFGSGTTCYGKCAGQVPSESPDGRLPDVLPGSAIGGGTVSLPFDLDQVVNNLRSELYCREVASSTETSMTARAYYLVRPLLSVSVRKHFQKWRLRDWKRLPFPRWPVDTTVDRMLEQTMLLSVRAQSEEPIPFVWFWPDGASSCAIMTHDVETELGVHSCPYLMDMEDAFGIKGSFQIIPERRYDVTPKFLDSIRQRGFEVVVHDLNHDGQLFRD